ncbi:hypothetical protein GCM10010276_13970 [Streptomyces longisporus]|uniref:Uncharacterized protein n=1 Tax=Streptomyces longisporus TaxID=1948 RepID=A0ABN3L9F7_STRLO
MGRVDLPVPVAHRPAAGTGDHRCKFGTEPGIVVHVGTDGLFADRLPWDTGLHNPYPINLLAAGHPRGGAFSRPTESGPGGQESPPYG